MSELKTSPFDDLCHVIRHSTTRLEEISRDQLRLMLAGRKVLVDIETALKVYRAVTEEARSQEAPPS